MSPARQPKLIQLFTASSRLRVSLMPRLIFLLVVSSFASPLSTLRVFKGKPNGVDDDGKTPCGTIYNFVHYSVGISAPWKL